MTKFFQDKQNATRYLSGMRLVVNIDTDGVSNIVREGASIPENGHQFVCRLDNTQADDLQIRRGSKQFGSILVQYSHGGKNSGTTVNFEVTDLFESWDDYYAEREADEDAYEDKFNNHVLTVLENLFNEFLATPAQQNNSWFLTYERELTAFVWRGGYDTRATPKDAGFNWDSDDKFWWTQDAAVAGKLAKYADSLATAALV